MLSTVGCAREDFSVLLGIPHQRHSLTLVGNSSNSAVVGEFRSARKGMEVQGVMGLCQRSRSNSEIILRRYMLSSEAKVLPPRRNHAVSGEF